MVESNFGKLLSLTDKCLPISFFLLFFSSFFHFIVFFFSFSSLFLPFFSFFPLLCLFEVSFFLFFSFLFLFTFFFLSFLFLFSLFFLSFLVFTSLKVLQPHFLFLLFVEVFFIYQFGISFRRHFLSKIGCNPRKCFLLTKFITCTSKKACKIAFDRMFYGNLTPKR